MEKVTQLFQIDSFEEDGIAYAVLFSHNRHWWYRVDLAANSWELLPAPVNPHEAKL